MVNDKRTTLYLSDVTKKSIKKFIAIDDASTRTDWIKVVTEFREELNKMPPFTDLPYDDILNLIRSYIVYFNSRRE